MTDIKFGCPKCHWVNKVKEILLMTSNTSQDKEGVHEIPRDEQDIVMKITCNNKDCKALIWLKFRGYSIELVPV